LSGARRQRLQLLHSLKHMTDSKSSSAKDQFLEQVELRLSIMEGWIKKREVPWRTGEDGKPLRDDDGELVPDFAPTTLVEFCGWTPEKSSSASGQEVSKLRTISRESLYKPYHSSLREVVDDKIKAVKACLAHQVEKKNKTSLIAELQAMVTLLNNIVEAQQRESRQARMQVDEVTKKFRMRHEEQRRVIAQLKADLAAEASKVASLTATLAKVSQLRPAPASKRPDQ
jgi:hypothetical protein